MKWKLSANAGFFGLRRDRFVQYQPSRTLEEKFALVARVRGVEGIELKFPGDGDDPAAIRPLMERHGLRVAAVNVDTKDIELFRHGALSARSAHARAAAVSRLGDGMALAAELGAGLATTCPLADGHDYPFQADPVGAWPRFIESAAAAAARRPDVRLALEYQPHEPHAKVMLSDAGKALHVCAEAAAPNLGVNLDVGHSFAAGESPAEAAALLASKGRLFYVHTNDNTGEGGDWDMISGTVHFWHWLEFLFTLRRVGYEGWLGGDIAPKHIGPVEAYDANFRLIERMDAMLDRIGMERLEDLALRDGNIAEVFEALGSALDG